MDVGVHVVMDITTINIYECLSVVCTYINSLSCSSDSISCDPAPLVTRFAAWTYPVCLI